MADKQIALTWIETRSFDNVLVYAVRRTKSVIWQQVFWPLVHPTSDPRSPVGLKVNGDASEFVLTEVEARLH